MSASAVEDTEFQHVGWHLLLEGKQRIAGVVTTMLGNHAHTI